MDPIAENASAALMKSSVSSNISAPRRTLSSSVSSSAECSAVARVAASRAIPGSPRRERQTGVRDEADDDAENAPDEQ